MDGNELEISAILISYNGIEFLPDCLKTLSEDLKGLRHEIIVVDNGSSDGSLDFVREKYPFMTLIENGKNMGFAAAVNIGIHNAKGEYLYILNQDLRFREGTAEKLISRIKQDKNIGLIGPKYVGFDGSLQRCTRGFPSYKHVFYALLRLHRLFPRNREFGHWFMTWFDHETEAFVDQPMGAVMLIPEKVVRKVGYMDENLPIFFNDVDYCRRIMMAGYKRLYYPETIVEHFVGGSTRKMKKRMLFFSRWALYRYLKKYAAPRDYLLFGLCVVAIVLDFLYELIFSYIKK